MAKLNDSQKKIVEFAISYIDNYILDPDADLGDWGNIQDTALDVRDELTFLIADKVIINGKVVRNDIGDKS